MSRKERKTSHFSCSDGNILTQGVVVIGETFFVGKPKTGACTQHRYEPVGRHLARKQKQNVFQNKSRSDFSPLRNSIMCVCRAPGCDKSISSTPFQTIRSKSNILQPPTHGCTRSLYCAAGPSLINTAKTEAATLSRRA